MKKTAFLTLAVVVAWAFTGCGQKPASHQEGESEAAHGGHDHGESGAEGAKYSEGKGIELMEETGKAIGLVTAEAEERELTPMVPVEAQVYRAASEPSRPGREQTGSAYATAFLPPRLAGSLKAGDSAAVHTATGEFSARVWRIEPASRDAVNNEEVILEIADKDAALRVGEFVSGAVTRSGGAASVVAIPRSAVLETATGKFVFVENGRFLLRAPVTTGAESADYIEIADGLYAGDVVAIQPVETLYLIELRSTKGGGHSH